MNIKYPVEINIHGDLVDGNGIVLAKDVVIGALDEIFTDISNADPEDLKYIVKNSFL